MRAKLGEGQEIARDVSGCIGPTVYIISLICEQARGIDISLLPSNFPDLRVDCLCKTIDFIHSIMKGELFQLHLEQMNGAWGTIAKYISAATELRKTFELRR